MKQKLIFLTIILTATIATSLFFLIPLTTKAQTTDQQWQLSISGYVNNSQTFTMADLKSMPQTTVTATIYCVDVPNKVVETGDWQGVKLSYLLNQAGVSPSAVKVALYAGDGYSTDLTLDLANNDNVILAYAKDGTPLGEGLRLVVPNHWGYKWISQVQRIELVDYNFLGKWESQGYSDDASITHRSFPRPSITPRPTTTPKILTPSPTATPTITDTSPSTSASTSITNYHQQDIPNYLTTTIVITGVIIVAIAAIAIVLAKTKRPQTGKTP